MSARHAGRFVVEIWADYPNVIPKRQCSVRVQREVRSRDYSDGRCVSRIGGHLGKYSLCELFDRLMVCADIELLLDDGVHDGVHSEKKRSVLV